MAELKRLTEVLKTSADALEGLYKELDRKPPPEAVSLIKELREFASDVLISQDFLNSKLKLS